MEKDIEIKRDIESEWRGERERENIFINEKKLQPN